MSKLRRTIVELAASLSAQTKRSPVSSPRVHLRSRLLQIITGMTKSVKKFRYDDDVLRTALTSRNCLVQMRNCLLLPVDDSGASELIVDDLWFENGVIVNAEEMFYVQQRLPDVQIDCDGLIVAPGFIDIQINGGFGVDFTNVHCDAHEYDNGLFTVAKGLLSHGCTSFCPTIISSQPAVYKKLLPHLKHRSGGPHGATILGAHVEGPFISRDKRGAHPIQNLRDTVQSGDVQTLYGDDFESVVRIVTIAPELPGAIAAISELSGRTDIVFSLGHSNSSMAEAECAVAAGARAVTHLYNAMDAYHHRDPSLIGLLASEHHATNIHYGIIADGIHTHDSALRIAYRTHPRGLVLVTDAVVALGKQDGVHKFGDITIRVCDRRATLVDAETREDTGRLAGSVFSMDQCLRHFRHATACSVVDAVHCATLHPARLLGVADRIGTLAVGAQADVVLLSANLQPRATYISGQLVWSAQGK